MDKYPTKKIICLLALIVVTPVLCQRTLYAEGQNSPIRGPVMSIEDQTLVRREPKVNSEWTWMTADHADHILKSHGYSNIQSLVRYKTHWQGIVTKDSDQKVYYNGLSSYFVDIDRYGDVNTYLGSDIVQRWPMFSSEEVLSLKNREDLVDQIHVKYEISNALAETEVEAFLNGKRFYIYEK